VEKLELLLSEMMVMMLQKQMVVVVLPCKAVIHTVGPRMGEGKEDYKLRKAVRSSLLLASEKGFISISMPAISSGIFGFSKERCAKILVEESKTFFQDNDDKDGANSRNNNNSASTLHLIEFCIFDNNTLNYLESI
jgi:O-acetyl-ADP-ribose deacetylase